mmetsp:Transcript_19112/g.44390  ORF Transcript_19112/g.44390 Transcript_19112/m.44390 type:complete len:238 (+) Transcript_19112:298-1011(+)
MAKVGAVAVGRGDELSPAIVPQLLLSSGLPFPLLGSLSPGLLHLRLAGLLILGLLALLRLGGFLGAPELAALFLVGRLRGVPVVGRGGGGGRRRRPDQQPGRREGGLPGKEPRAPGRPENHQGGGAQEDQGSKGQQGADEGGPAKAIPEGGTEGLTRAAAAARSRGKARRHDRQRPRRPSPSKPPFRGRWHSEDVTKLRYDKTAKDCCARCFFVALTKVISNRNYLLSPLPFRRLAV